MNTKHTKCSYDQLIGVMKNYADILSKNTVLLPHQNATWVELIKLFKRDRGAVGPYKNVSIFEGLNRIASDMVLLHGLRGLFEEGKPSGISSVSFCLGNTSDGEYSGDFCIYDSAGEILAHGEAFNAAEQFFRPKIASVRKKWKDKKLHFILCNPSPIAKGITLPDGCTLLEVARWEEPLCS